MALMNRGLAEWELPIKMKVLIMTKRYLSMRKTQMKKRAYGPSWKIQVPQVLCYTCGEPIEIGQEYVAMQRRHSPARHLECALEKSLVSEEELN